MRHILTPLLILAVVLSFVSSAAGQWDNRNAATWYRKVVEAFGWEYETNSTYPDSVRLLTREEEAILDAYRKDPSGVPSPQVRRALTKAGPMMEWLRRGSQQKYSDFDLDYSQGFGLVLPHLSSLRAASKVMYTDALVRMHDGDITGATDRVASLYRMSGHVGSDRIIISSLIGSAVFNLTDRATQTALDRGQLTAFDSAILVNALKTLDARDPFNYVEAVTGEQVMVFDWMAQRFGRWEDRQNAGNLDFIFQGEEHDQRFVEMSDDEFAAEIGLYDQFMGQVVEAFMMDDPEEGRAALMQLEAAAASGEHRMFAEAFSPAFSRVFDQMHKSRAMLVDRLAELETLAQGQVKPEEFVNGAVFYLRGIELMRRIEDTRFQNALDYQSGAVEESDVAILKTLTDAQPVVDLFREGSEKRRCDFTDLRRAASDQFCPDYLAGMGDALRLILADAMRLLEAGEADAVIDRLAICYRAVAHLTGDELILSAMVAHRTFRETHALNRRFQKSEAWTEAHRESLLKAVERIGRKDPFGYVGSIMSTRVRLGDSLRTRRFTGKEGEAGRVKAIQLIKGRSGDKLLILTIARDTVNQAAAEKAETSSPTSTPPQATDAGNPEPGPHPLTRMEGIIDFEALVAVRDEAEAIDALYWAGRVDEIFSTSAYPRVAPVLDWMRRARADLRDCIIRLRPPMAAPQVPAEPPV